MFVDFDKLQEYLSNVYQLKNVIRYNTRPILKQESVAEHSFYVALFTLKICDDYNINENIKKDAVIKSLLHDMPEIELNDITHNVKEKLRLRPFLKAYEDEYYKTHYSQYYELMSTSHDLTSIIVVLADAWSVFQYVNNEMSLGNKSKQIEEIDNEIRQRIQDLTNALECALQEK